MRASTAQFAKAQLRHCEGAGISLDGDTTGLVVDFVQSDDVIRTCSLEELQADQWWRSVLPADTVSWIEAWACPAADQPKDGPEQGAETLQ